MRNPRLEFCEQIVSKYNKNAFGSRKAFVIKNLFGCGGAICTIPLIPTPTLSDPVPRGACSVSGQTCCRSSALQFTYIWKAAMPAAKKRNDWSAVGGVDNLLYLQRAGLRSNHRRFVHFETGGGTLCFLMMSRRSLCAVFRPMLCCV